MLKDGSFDAYGKRICGECLGGVLWDPETGEYVCTKCGAVTRSLETDSLVAAQNEAPNRAVSPSPMASIIRNDLEIPTVVGPRNFDANGRTLNENYELRQLRRLASVVSWDSKRRRTARVSAEVRRISEALGLSNVVSTRAYEIYMKSFDPKVGKANSISAGAAASVCAACVELEIPRPSDETVALKVNIDERKLRHHYKVLVKNMPSASAPNPAIYVPAIAARASLGGSTERKALEVLREVKGSGALVGKRPVSIAAAALYLASLETREAITQMRMAFAAGVSPITIRKRSAEIAKALGRDFEPIQIR